jgi:hypothetical protein
MYKMVILKDYFSYDSLSKFDLFVIGVKVGYNAWDDMDLV